MRRRRRSGEGAEVETSDLTKHQPLLKKDFNLSLAAETLETSYTLRQKSFGHVFSHTTAWLT